MSLHTIIIPQNAVFVRVCRHLIKKNPRINRGLCLQSETTVETVVLLSQQKPDDYIEIEIDLDEIDATSAERKASYDEISPFVRRL